MDINQDSKSAIQTWLLPAGLIIAAMAWSFRDAFISLYGNWMDNDDFSHGLLIIPIAAYLIWERREQVLAITPKVDWRGAAAMVASVGLYIIGELGAELFTTRVAIVCMAISAIWWLYGFRMLRTLAFPFSLLFLMLPLPGFIYRNITFSLQILSSVASVEILNAFGYLAFREGNIIDMGFDQFQVVDACNGLRFILPMLTLGVLFAFARPQIWWKRIILIAVTVPLAMATNILRIVGTGILANYFGSGVAQGFFHDFSGWVVFMVSFALFGVVALILTKIPGAPSEPRKKKAADSQPMPNRRLRMTATGAAIVLCLTSPLVVSVMGSVEPIPLKKELGAFPLQIDGWTGRVATMDEAMWDRVGGQAYRLVNYNKPGHLPVNFYTAYYEYQRKAGDFIHSPKLCLPGAGWYIKSNRARTVPREASPSDFEQLRFNELVIEKGENRQLVYFWYQGRDRNFTSEYAAKFYMVWDGIFRRRTDGALVRVIMPLADATLLSDARTTLDRFAVTVSKQLDHHLP